jgi:hypothetical protein
MSFDRTTIIRGPAQITYKGNKYYSQGDIRLNVGHEVFDIVNSAFGLVEQRSQQRTATVTFTPVGTFFLDLWDYGSKKSGDRLLGDTNQDLVVWSYHGTRATIYNVGITKIPDLTLSTVKTLAGEVTFTGLGQGGASGVDIVAQNTPNSFVFIEEGLGAPSDSFDPALIPTEPYLAAWGDFPAPWNDLQTSNGWQCSFDLNLTPVVVDKFGIIDWTVGNVRATARSQILGVTEAQVIAKVGIDVLRGAAILSTKNLVITGSTLKATIHSSQVRLMPAQFGLTTLRLADIEWVGTRRVVSNAVTDVFTIEAV